MKISLKIPKEVSQITEALENAGFSAFLVGGCVRDLVMNKKPKDWDIATEAQPEEIIALFEKTVYENAFGTVTVVNQETTNESLKNIEITPFRTESHYSDRRHPDKITFGKSVEEDLARRDFTINALAYRESKGQLIDKYEGIKDIREGLIRAVGTAEERFNEDPLRIMRGVRLSTELGFIINEETEKAMKKTSGLLKHISIERIRDEVSRITESNQPMQGFITLQKIGVLKEILPEMEKTVGVTQNNDHIYDVWEHSLRAMQHAADKDWPLHIRLSALFHDIGKPKTKRWSKEKNDYTFYGHEVVGAKMTEKIMLRMKFPKKTSLLIVKLVRHHMFFSDIDKITLSAVRRIISKVGEENVWDLMKLRACDRIGMGRPKENPYRLRKYESMIEEALRDPTSVKMLKINGQNIMNLLNVKPGPKIGLILHTLLEEVLSDPSLNNKEYLEERAKKLITLSEKELKELGEKGKSKKEETEKKEISKIRKKHGVN